MNSVIVQSVTRTTVKWKALPACALIAVSTHAWADADNELTLMVSDVSGFLHVAGAALVIAAVLWIAYELIFMGARMHHARQIAWGSMLIVASRLAHAQLTDKPARMAADVAAMLQAMGVSMFIAAVLWVAYRMIFAGASFRDVANVAWGGVLAGAAAAIAGWAMSA